MFFNSEIKNQYLETCTYKQDTIKRIETFFHKSFVLENLFEKDIISFNKEELELLFYSFKCKTFASIKVVVSIARHYIYWRVDSGYKLLTTPIVNSSSFKGRNLESFMNHDGDKGKYIKDYDELYALTTHLINPRDKAIICLLYEGVCGKDYCELRNLKREDCDFYSNQIRIINREDNSVKRMVNCNKNTMSIVFKAIYTDVYIRCNGDDNRYFGKTEMDLIASDYVIRNTRGSVDSSNKLITLILEKIKSVNWGEPNFKYLTPTTIRDSGMFNCVAQIEASKEGSITYEEFLNVLKCYGKGEKVLNQYWLKYNLFKQI